MAKQKNDVEKTPEQLTQEQLIADNEYVIKNKRVRRQARRRAVVIILLVFLLIIALLAGVTYAIMRFVDNNNFRVTVTQTGTSWLSLSKDFEFTNPTSVLDVSAPKNMDNCSICNYLDGKLKDIYDSNGAYQGEGTKDYFIATSFYLKNSGIDPIGYREMISIERAMRNMDKAIRVLVIKDEDPTDDKYGTITVYAAAQCDAKGKTLTDEVGNSIPEEVVPGVAYNPRSNSLSELYKDYEFAEGTLTEDGTWLTVPFAGSGYVLNSELFPLNPGEVIKYSIVIWLEGEDPQCVGDSSSTVDSERGILGGQVKLAVEFVTQNTK